ncbi:MAG: hypothetical protein ABIR34_12980 [Marmoricola sp.]
MSEKKIASSHEMPWIEAQDTSMSNNKLALVGAAGLNPRKRLLSPRVADEAGQPRVELLGREGPMSRGTRSIRRRFSAYARTLRTIRMDL